MTTNQNKDQNGVIEKKHLITLDDLFLLITVLVKKKELWNGCRTVFYRRVSKKSMFIYVL